MYNLPEYLRKDGLAPAVNNSNTLKVNEYTMPAVLLNKKLPPA